LAAKVGATFSYTFPPSCTGQGKVLSVSGA
jgi:hypothetical protein